MLTLPSFWVPAVAQVTELFGLPHYEFLHRLPSVQRSLRALYGRFMDFTASHGCMR